jgi:hypothetical protein
MPTIPDAHCQRCQRPLRLARRRTADARMLRRSQTPEGLCVNCAVHDWLRHTYPVNMLLDEGNPDALLVPYLQQQFIAIMHTAGADAIPAEIDWQVIVDQWDLPWPTPVRKSAANPWDERAERSSDVSRRSEAEDGRLATEGRTPMTITSFAQLNAMAPGAGDELRAALRRAFRREDERDA